MYAGPGYAAGRAWNSTATVSATAWQVAPVSYLDAVTKDHDINYTYIEKTYMAPGTDGVLRPKEGLNMADVNRALWQADLEMLANVLKSQPTNWLEATYRQALIQGFIAKADVGYGRDIDLVADWNAKLAGIDPQFGELQRLENGGANWSLFAGVHALGTYTSTGMQELATSGVNVQVAMLFNQHLDGKVIQARDYAPPIDFTGGLDYTQRILKPVRGTDQDGKTLYTAQGYIDGKWVEESYAPAAGKFTRIIKAEAGGSKISETVYQQDRDSEDRPIGNDYGHGHFTVTQTVYASGAGTVQRTWNLNPDAVPTLDTSAHFQVIQPLVLQGDASVFGQRTALDLDWQAGGASALNPRASGAVSVQTVSTAAGDLITNTYDAQGQLLSSAKTELLDDLSTKTTTTYADGRVVTTQSNETGILYRSSDTTPIGAGSTSRVQDGAGNWMYNTTSSTNPAGQLTMTVERQIDGHTVKVEFTEDEWGELQAGRVVSVDGQAIEGDSAFDDLLNYQGYDAWGFADGATPLGSAPLDALFQAHNPLEKQGLQTLVTALTRTADALSLLSAIQSGKPLPILASGLRLANAIPGAANDAARAGFNLSGVTNAVSGVLSLMSLDAAIKNGDTIGAITAGAQALSFGASAWVDFAAQNVLTATTFEATAAAHAAFDGAAGFQQSVGKVLPALNIVNSLAHGDYVGAAVYTISLSFPPLGIAYTVFSLIKGLFGGDDEPQPWASGRWGWNAQGQPVPLVTGGDGGEATLTNLMNQLQGILAQLAGQEGNGLGLIPERLPGLGFRDNTYHLADIDYASGAENLPDIRYTTAGQPHNAPAGSEEGYWSLTERFVRVALEHGAIAPQWEADTARLQTQNRLNDAGLTEEDRAAKANKLAGPATGASQAFRPVVLDLDGDGIQITAKDQSGVAFDVDDSGFLKATGWLANEGANTDGYLWLDRNWNGAIDTGSELFSNAKVQAGIRGVPSLAWVDADGDGRITNADPVWNALKVWRDTNGNGMGDPGEVWALDGLNISELDYTHGRYTMGGQIRQLASPEIDADTAGTRTHVIPEGILVETTGNGISLVATRVDDLSALEANRDGVTGFEDVELIVSGASLCLWSYRRQKPLSLQSCPKWAANDPEHRAAA